MAKQQEADVPAMCPLQRDHKLPEKSQTGITKIPDKVVNPVKPQQSEKEVRTNANLPIVNNPTLRPI